MSEDETPQRIAITQIRGILKLPPQASMADIVGRVRELKAVEDLSLEVHKRRKPAQRRDLTGTRDHRIP